ncbi:MAG TPA: hypothetical protein VJT31_23985, partial [Rugosimonospora sp.]|nr:hypothetical protein [Rugosimonospora sp.]
MEIVADDARTPDEEPTSQLPGAGTPDEAARRPPGPADTAPMERLPDGTANERPPDETAPMDAAHDEPAGRAADETAPMERISGGT